MSSTLTLFIRAIIRSAVRCTLYSISYRDVETQRRSKELASPPHPSRLWLGPAPLDHYRQRCLKLLSVEDEPRDNTIFTAQSRLTSRHSTTWQAGTRRFRAPHPQRKGEERRVGRSSSRLRHFVRVAGKRTLAPVLQTLELGLQNARATHLQEGDSGKHSDDDAGNGPSAHPTRLRVEYEP